MTVRNILGLFCLLVLTASCNGIAEDSPGLAGKWTVVDWKSDYQSIDSFEKSKSGHRNNPILNSLLGLEADGDTKIGLELNKDSRFIINHSGNMALSGKWTRSGTSLVLQNGNAEETFGILEYEADSVLLTHKGEGSFSNIKITLR